MSGKQAKEKRKQKNSHGEGRITPVGNSYRFEICLPDIGRKSKNRKKAEFKSKSELNTAFAEWVTGLKADAKAKAEKEAGIGIVTVGELLDKFVTLQSKNVSSFHPIAYMVNAYLKKELGEVDARSPHLLTKVEEYRDKRALQLTYKKTPTRNRTINLEITYLKQALQLLRPEPRYLKIVNLPVKGGVRRGLVMLEEYHAILAELEPYQQPVWCFSFYVGRRRSELLRLRRDWAKNALKTGYIEGPGWHGEERITKNGEDSYIPLYMDSMKKFLRWALDNGDPKCPYLFQRVGERTKKATRIHDKLYYEDFKEAEARLKMKHIHYHDTRRTAVTNMIEAGIPEEEAMAVSGHIDPRVFRKYRIVTKKKARQNVLKTGEKMKAWYAEQETTLTDYANITPSQKMEDGVEADSHASKPN